MKVTVVLHFSEFKNDPAQSWLVDASAWKSDLGERISTGDLKATLEQAIDHTVALMQEKESLTITLETSRR